MGEALRAPIEIERGIRRTFLDKLMNWNNRIHTIIIIRVKNHQPEPEMDWLPAVPYIIQSSILLRNLKPDPDAKSEI